MTKIKYFKIPIWRVSAVDKNLRNGGCISFSRVGHKKYYKFENMVVSIDRNIATVVHDIMMPDTKISSFFS
jgi:hypothetical protein